MERKLNGFDRRLRFLLTANGMTRKELAHRLGVTVPVVSRWLNGASLPDIYQFREIAHFSGMPYEWFLDARDDIPNTMELAVRLGLSEDTVEALLKMAESESPEVLAALDDAVCSVISVVNAVYDDLLRIADAAAEDTE